MDCFGKCDLEMRADRPEEGTSRLMSALRWLSIVRLELLRRRRRSRTELCGQLWPLRLLGVAAAGGRREGMRADTEARAVLNHQIYPCKVSAVDVGLHDFCFVLQVASREYVWGL